MFEKYYDSLSENSKQLIDDGYFIVDVDSKPRLESIKESFVNCLEQEYDLEIPGGDLHHLHEVIPIALLNDIRIGSFQFLNQSTSNFTFDFLELASSAISDVVGTELASNRMVNLSIQLPGDETSLLPIHSDIFSGESTFEINLWVPFVDVHATNAMFIFNPEFSQDVCSNISRYEESGIDHLLDDHPNEYQHLELSYGQALIFTPTCLHGNVLNQTEHSRISLNCRYKNLYSPYNEAEESEKKLGSFYQPLTPKAASIIGFNFELSK